MTEINYLKKYDASWPYEGGLDQGDQRMASWERQLEEGRNAEETVCENSYEGRIIAYSKNWNKMNKSGTQKKRSMEFEMRL